MIFIFTYGTIPHKEIKTSVSIDVIAAPDGSWIDIPPAHADQQSK